MRVARRSRFDMDLSPAFPLAAGLLAPALMLLACAASLLATDDPRPMWRRFNLLAAIGLAATLAAAVAFAAVHAWGTARDASADAGAAAQAVGLAQTALGVGLALLVQLLGTVIGRFSSRYLDGEPRQSRYAAALAAVLAGVHLLLLADHWVLLIASWAAIGLALQRLLCFYADRPFALLAAHKKRLADRSADALLLAAAALAWWTVGSGSFSDLADHLATQGAAPALQASAGCLVLAVVLRTALLPVHGWLIQVMEAPTPVSALLHAGVVNLGGFVLIRFATLLEHATAARWLLVGAGLATALLAGLVMLTRVSIKVRLAWSTVAQMGFMVMECGLGLYTLAALHLIGHSLYKAQAFLSASGAVRDTRLRMMYGGVRPSAPSLMLAPLVAVPLVALVEQLGTAGGWAAWPAWWSGVLGLAWAPVLWLPRRQAGGPPPGAFSRAGTGVLLVALLTAAALLAHALPLQLRDAPDGVLGWVACAGMAVLYASLVLLQLRPEAVSGWRRWSYAGFYVDELYTRLTLRLWPARWTPDGGRAGQHAAATGS